MYSYLVSKDEYGRIKQQSRNEGQNLYFPKHGDNIQSAEQVQTYRQTPESPDEEGESISFIAGQEQTSSTGRQGQASYPNRGGQGGEGESISFIGGQRQEPYPNTRGQGFTYPQGQGYGGEQSKGGKKVNAKRFHWVFPASFRSKTILIISSHRGMVHPGFNLEETEASSPNKL